jgi:hypothetical protein
MHSKDSGELWNVAVNVTVLPSMLMNIWNGGVTLRQSLTNNKNGSYGDFYSNW